MKKLFLLLPFYFHGEKYHRWHPITSRQQIEEKKQQTNKIFKLFHQSRLSVSFTCRVCVIILLVFDDFINNTILNNCPPCKLSDADNFPRTWLVTSSAHGAHRQLQQQTSLKLSLILRKHVVMFCTSKSLQANFTHTFICCYSHQLPTIAHPVPISHSYHR